MEKRQDPEKARLDGTGQRGDKLGAEETVPPGSHLPLDPVMKPKISKLHYSSADSKYLGNLLAKHPIPHCRWTTEIDNLPRPSVLSIGSSGSSL